MATITYLDVNTDFGVNVSPALVTDMDAIRNKVMNLFRCTLGSRLRQPLFGTKLLEYVHEPCDDITASDILDDLVYAVRKWIPEIVVDLQQSVVTPLPGNYGFGVNIIYHVPRLAQQGGLNFSALRT